MDEANALVISGALDTKLTQLQFPRNRTEKIIHNGKSDAVERQMNALIELSSEADHYKRKLEELKITAKENADEVKTWGDGIEERIAEADDDIARLRDCVAKGKMEESNKLCEDELRYERKLFKTRLQFQTELKEAKSQGQGGGSSGESKDVATKLEAKLPKFNGTFQDWLRFWGQFCEAIDNSNIAGVPKLSYLRELLVPKVKASIEGLPFSSEGYMRAKSILKDKYRKESEIVKAYNKEILELPVISGVNVKKIHEFTDRLTYCLQSLETMGKLEQVNGNVSMTLDNLPGNRGDLVCTDNEWESWDFVKLCEALHLLTRCNPIDVNSSQKPDTLPRRRDKLFNARAQGPKQAVKQNTCVYCDDM